MGLMDVFTAVQTQVTTVLTALGATVPQFLVGANELANEGALPRVVWVPAVETIQGPHAQGGDGVSQPPPPAHPPRPGAGARLVPGHPRLRGPWPTTWWPPSTTSATGPTTRSGPTGPSVRRRRPAPAGSTCSSGRCRSPSPASSTPRHRDLDAHHPAGGLACVGARSWPSTTTPPGDDDTIQDLREAAPAAPAAAGEDRGEVGRGQGAVAAGLRRAHLRAAGRRRRRGGTIAISMASLTGPRHNPEYGRFAAAKASLRMARGQGDDRGEFDAAIKAAGEHVGR
jgi:hypothetical protein